MLAQVRLETRLHVRVALGKPIVHLAKQLVLLLEARGELRHVGVRGLVLEPDLRVRPDDVLDPTAEEAHEHKVLEFGVHGDGLVLLRRATHVNAILRLTVGDHTRAPARDDAHGAVHGGDDLPTHFAQPRVGQPSHSVHQRVQLLDHRRHRSHIVRHLERPLLAVLAALVQVFAVGAVAGDHVQRLADQKVLECGAVHGFTFLYQWL